MKIFSRKSQKTQLEELQAENSRLQRRIEELTLLGNPTYDADHMRLWNHNVDFLEDQSFRRAYEAGINSNHQLGGPGADADIHIEWRIAICCWAAFHSAQLPGDFVECGTNTGIMSLSICDYIGWDGRKHFYLFDTFKGIPEDQIGDAEQHAYDQNKVYRDCYVIAKENFEKYKNVFLVRGKVPDTLKEYDIPQVSYLMLDMNIVYPEIQALMHFWDRMVPGGIILFDDYGWVGYEQQKRAHDAFANKMGCQIWNLPTGQGMLIKPN